MGPMESGASHEISQPGLGLMIGIPVSLCIWGLLDAVAEFATV